MSTDVIWHSHACFSINSSVNILIDPFFNGNPKAIENPDDIKPDIILLTHGHFDHSGDAIKISKRSGAPVLASFELSELLKKEGIKTIDINPGGTVEFKNIKITAVKAVHSSSYEGKYAGCAMGYIIDNGEKTFYHAGDTGIFSDMELYGKLYKPEIAMLPIGGHYTMDINGAIESLKMLGSKIVIPMHYNTFPAIEADPSKLVAGAEKIGVQCIIPEIGKKITF